MPKPKYLSRVLDCAYCIKLATCTLMNQEKNTQTPVCEECGNKKLQES